MATPTRPRPGEALGSAPSGPALVTLVLALAGAWLLVRAEAGAACWAAAAAALLVTFALTRTLSWYHQTQGPALADARADGAVPWAAMARELGVLWGLETLRQLAGVARLVALGGLLSPLLGVRPSWALPAAAAGLAALPMLETVRAALARKQRRFYRFDGVVVVPPPGSPPRGLRRLEAWVDAALVPPSLAAAPDTIELLQATYPLPEGRCPVCHDALEEPDAVRCTRCGAGHHRDCFDFAEVCARYGCGGREASPADGPGEPEARAEGAPGAGAA